MYRRVFSQFEMLTYTKSVHSRWNILLDCACMYTYVYTTLGLDYKCTESVGKNGFEIYKCTRVLHLKLFVLFVRSDALTKLYT